MAGVTGTWTEDTLQTQRPTGWRTLSSTNLAAYNYDPGRQSLKIRFSSGRVYEYDGVPTSVVDELASAASAGKYFNSAIKMTYAYKRV